MPLLKASFISAVKALKLISSLTSIRTTTVCTGNKLGAAVTALSTAAVAEVVNRVSTDVA
jgi:hypothetical protein